MAMVVLLPVLEMGSVVVGVQMEEEEQEQVKEMEEVEEVNGFRPIISSTLSLNSSAGQTASRVVPSEAKAWLHGRTAIQRKNVILSEPG